MLTPQTKERIAQVLRLLYIVGVGATLGSSIAPSFVVALQEMLTPFLCMILLLITIYYLDTGQDHLHNN